jgi:hypothetical protein
MSMRNFPFAALAALSLLALPRMGTASETAFSREVPLWPESSSALKDGIRELSGETWALTHPSFLIYRP